MVRDLAYIHLSCYKQLPGCFHSQLLHIAEDGTAEQLFESFLELELIQSEFPAKHAEAEVCEQVLLAEEFLYILQALKIGCWNIRSNGPDVKVEQGLQRVPQFSVIIMEEMLRIRRCCHFWGHVLIRFSYMFIRLSYVPPGLCGITLRKNNT